MTRAILSGSVQKSKSHGVLQLVRGGVAVGVSCGRIVWRRVTVSHGVVLESEG